MASTMAPAYLRVSGATQPIMDQRCFVLRNISHGSLLRLKIHGIEIPFSSDQLTEAITRVIQENGFNACYVRPIAYFGSGSLSLYPRECAVEVVILVWPWADYLGAEGQRKGVSVTVSPWRKFESKMMPTTAKACGQYVNSVLAIREAVNRGFAEAILLDAGGQITEGSGENLFIVSDKQLLTNDASHSRIAIHRDGHANVHPRRGLRKQQLSIPFEVLLSRDPQQ